MKITKESIQQDVETVIHEMKQQGEINLTDYEIEELKKRVNEIASPDYILNELKKMLIQDVKEIMQGDSQPFTLKNALIESKAAKLLGVSYSTLKEHRLNGKPCPTHYRISERKIFYTISDIQDFIKNSKRTARLEG